MCEKTCCKQKEEKGLYLTREEVSFIIKTLNEHMFSIGEITIAYSILNKIDVIYPIKEE